MREVGSKAAHGGLRVPLDTGLFHLSACSACGLAPRDGRHIPSSLPCRGRDEVPTHLYFVKESLCLTGQDSNIHASQTKNWQRAWDYYGWSELGRSQFSATKDCQQPNMSGALLIQRKKVKWKWWLGGNQQGPPNPHIQSPPNLLILPPKQLLDSSSSLHLLYHYCNPSHSHLLLGLLQ